MLVTRGFQGRGRQGANADRIPPGQYLGEDFPVLTAGPRSARRWTSGRSRCGGTGAS